MAVPFKMTGRKKFGEAFQNAKQKPKSSGNPSNANEHANRVQVLKAQYYKVKSDASSGGARPSNVTFPPPRKSS